MRLTNNYGLEIHDAVPQDAGDYICQIATLEPREITHTVEILGKFVIRHLSLSRAHSLCTCVESKAVPFAYELKLSFYRHNSHRSFFPSISAVDELTPSKRSLKEDKFEHFLASAAYV